jgi:hypothetical protein
MAEDWAPVREWHRAVNDGDIDALRAVACADIVMGGPKGEAVGVATLLAWVEHAGIRLDPVSWHPVDEETVVVEQDATWPGNPATEPTEPGARPVRVATLFRLAGGYVAAALRFDDLHAALSAANGGC